MGLLKNIKTNIYKLTATDKKKKTNISKIIVKFNNKQAWKDGIRGIAFSYHYILNTYLRLSRHWCMHISIDFYFYDFIRF